MNGRTKVFQEVLADLKSENPLITIHWIWYRKSSLILKVNPVHSINHGVVLNFQSVLQSFAFLPIWARNWLEQCANLQPAARTLEEILCLKFMKNLHWPEAKSHSGFSETGAGGWSKTLNAVPEVQKYTCSRSVGACCSWQPFGPAWLRPLAAQAGWPRPGRKEEFFCLEKFLALKAPFWANFQWIFILERG